MDTRGGNTWHTHDRGLTHTARVGKEAPIAITEWLETCQYIEKMVSIVPYPFKPESNDETVEVADQQEQDVSQW